MDRVRFGRALGEGTRDAARALLKAADAAAAPTPLPSTSKTAPAGFLASSGSTTAPQAVRRTDVVGVKDRRPGHRRLGQALWTPFARITSVVLLEVTGVLFALFFLVSGIDAWRHAGDLRASGQARTHLIAACAMTLVFGYFTVSSFVRAGRRGRS